MSRSPPFVNRETNELDLHQIWEEALPVVGLIVLFGALASLPYLMFMTVFEGTYLTLFLLLLAQLILAVGTAIVLMYIIARAIQLADA